MAKVWGDSSRGRIGTFWGNDPSLVGYWQLNGNSLDNSGNSNNGTDASVIYGGPFGKFGKGAYFNGTNSLITTPLTSISVSSKTVMAWVKTSTTTYQVICAQWAPPASWNLGINNDSLNSGILEFSTFNGTTSIFSKSSAPSLATGNWTHVAATYDSSNYAISFYVNGVLSGTATGNQSQSSTVGVGIGRENQTTIYGPYSGYLDEVAIFSRVLSASEISQYYNWAIGGNQRKHIFGKIIAIINYGASLLSQLMTQ